MKHSLLILAMILVLAGSALADGQFNIIGTGYSVQPGSNGTPAPFIQSGYYTTIPGGFLFAYGEYHQDIVGNEQQFGLGTLYGMPFWKFVGGVGINALKWDDLKDGETPGDYFAVDGMLMWTPQGLENSWFGFSMNLSYTPSTQKLNAGLGLTIKPK